MNAVEIEEAVSALIEQPFDLAGFPYEFLLAYGNKSATIDKLKKGDANKSDLERGVLQRNNIHIAVCTRGSVAQTLNALRESPASSKHKAKFLLATDGYEIEAEDLNSGDTIACEYREFPNRFAFFLPMAGITAIKQVKENSFDIRATSRLNRLYIELLKDNKDWATDERRSDMNHFMARLIFCFFAEDTDIFPGENLFTETVNRMSENNSSNTHEVISELFRAMDKPINERPSLGIRSWADAFPYVNGGLFAGNTEVPRFSRIARSYLIHIGTLEWRQVNPDIFGSMIQAVADDEERGDLGMHYTSVPNILKVLNPLFLDDLRAQFEAAGNSQQKLLNIRKRIAKIRIFDPACGSGNFLVIAYKEMREIESEINKRRKEADNRSVIPLTNFRGIELRDFSAQVARLALIIAEYQCNFLYRGQKEALVELLPLDTQNWIVCGNALRLDWLSVCPPTGTAVKHQADDLFHSPIDQAQIDFENEGGETYICGNPPYLGSVLQSKDQKADLEAVFGRYTKSWKSLDYVAGWFLKATEYGQFTQTKSALVSTNSICQGEQPPILWPIIFGLNHRIIFAHKSFKWTNLASHNAGVTVVIVGFSNYAIQPRIITELTDDGVTFAKETSIIGPYLVAGTDVVVSASSTPPDDRARMIRGNMANDGGFLILENEEASDIIEDYPAAKRFVKKYVGSREFINGQHKNCLWIEDCEVNEALACAEISNRVEEVRAKRKEGGKQARDHANTPHRFVFAPHDGSQAIIVPRVSSENRDYLPVGVVDGDTVISERNFALYRASLWNMALVASRMHWVWIGAVCVRMRTDFSYSNTLGWNTFPITQLTKKNKADLTKSAEDILLARETHFPSTIADLYARGSMPGNLRQAHYRNDEVIERIYIGRRFKNDTERLEKLFELYAKMTKGNDLANLKSRVS